MLARAVPGAAVLVCDVRAPAGAAGRARARRHGPRARRWISASALARDVDLVLVVAARSGGSPAAVGRLRERRAALGARRRRDRRRRRRPTWRGASGSLGPASTRRFDLRRSLGAPVMTGPAAAAIDRARPVLAVAASRSPRALPRRTRGGRLARRAAPDVSRSPSLHAARRRADRARRPATPAPTSSLTTEKDAVRLAAAAVRCRCRSPSCRSTVDGRAGRRVPRGCSTACALREARA